MVILVFPYLQVTIILTDEHSSSFKIIDSEAGVFMNDNKQHNGKVYLRYYFEEDEEIYDEKVCVVTIN